MWRGPCAPATRGDPWPPPANSATREGSRMMPMPPLAILFAEPQGKLREASERKRPLSSGTWHTLLRHQLGAVVAGIIDFGTMIFCVEVLKLSPVSATAVGATAGGVSNFGLGRAW